MRVAFFFDCLYPHTTGGAEKVYRRFAEAFRDAGHDTTYLTRKQWDGEDKIDDDGLRVRALIGSRGLYDVDGVRRPSTAVVFAAAIFFHLLRSRKRYDAVFVSATPVLNAIAARLALVGTGVLLDVDYMEVWTREQSIEYSGPLVGSIAYLLQSISIKVTRVASVHSSLMAARVTGNNFTGSVIRSPGLIPDMPGVTARTTTDPLQDPYVLFVGRHIQDKRADSIPPALKIARERYPRLRGIILGEGPETDRIRGAVRRAGLEDFISLPGFVSESELADLMRNAACLVNPSRREGYGLVIVEAAGYGTPSVITDHPNNAAVELVDVGVNGFIAPSDSPDALAAAIISALDGGESLRAATREWYDRVVQDRSLDRAAVCLVKEFETRAPSSPAAATSRGPVPPCARPGR